MADRRPIAADKIIFGTMRLLDAGRTTEQTADYLGELHDLGIRTLHSSSEYDSFEHFCDALSLLTKRSPGYAFRHMVKLAEPSFDDEDNFSALRLSSRIDGYRSALRTDVVDDVQWMWRRKLDDDAARIADFRTNARAIEEGVAAQKSAGSLGRLLCFPYSVDFASVAVQQDWVDGLAVYRNRKEQEYDGSLDQVRTSGKTAVVIRPFFGGKLVEDADPAELLADAIDGPAVEAAVLSTNSLDHMRALLS